MIAPIVFFVDIAMQGRDRTLTRQPCNSVLCTHIYLPAFRPVPFFGTRFNTFFAFSRLWFEIALLSVRTDRSIRRSPKDRQRICIRSVPTAPSLRDLHHLRYKHRGLSAPLFPSPTTRGEPSHPPAPANIPRHFALSFEDRYLFVGMEADGYRIFEKTDPVPNISSQADQLSLP